MGIFDRIKTLCYYTGTLLFLKLMRNIPEKSFLGEAFRNPPDEKMQTKTLERRGINVGGKNITLVAWSGDFLDRRKS